VNDAAGPTLSVLLVADSLDAIMPALRSYADGTQTSRLQVVVAAIGGVQIPTTAIAQLGFLDPVVVDGGSGELNVAEARAVRSATAPFVVFAQERAYLRPGAADRLSSACANGNWTIVAPALANANPRTVFSRASMRIKNSRWMDGQPAGPVENAPGHNTAYRRDALLALGDHLESSLEAGWQLQDELRARGALCYLESSAVIAVVNPEATGPFVRDFRRLGRRFAAQRARRWPTGMRLLFAAGSPLIPLVRLGRVVHTSILQERGTTLWRELPAVVLGLSASAAGEAAGYLFGPGSPTRLTDTR